jgi:hypothetical protein
LAFIEEQVMSDATPSTSPVATQSATPSRGLSRAAIVVLCVTYAVLGAGAGFWLGRLGPAREASTVAPSVPSAAALAEQNAAAEKRNYDRVLKQIELLDKEKNLLDLELNEDVLKKLAEKELQLGSDVTSTSSSWQGKQFQLQQLIESRTRVQSEIAGAQSRRDELAHRLEQRLALPQVEAQIQNNARYAEASRFADDAARQVDDVKSQSKPDADSVNAAERRSAAAAARLGSLHDELRSTIVDALKDQADGELNADTANLARLDNLIVHVGSELGTLNQQLVDYRVLQEREKRLRGQLDAVQERLSELRIFDLQGVPSPKLLKTSLPSSAE